MGQGRPSSPEMQFWFFQATSVSSSALPPPTLAPSAGTVVTELGTSSGSNSPEIKPQVSSEGRSTWLHGVKMPHNEDFQSVLLYPHVPKYRVLLIPEPAGI